MEEIVFRQHPRIREVPGFEKTVRPGGILLVGVGVVVVIVVVTIVVNPVVNEAHGGRRDEGKIGQDRSQQRPTRVEARYRRTEPAVRSPPKLSRQNPPSDAHGPEKVRVRVHILPRSID